VALAALAPRCDSEVGELREVLVAAPDPAGLALGGSDPGRHGFRAAADPARALAEWEAFAAALAAAGAIVRDLRAGGEGDERLPNLHYTRDIAIVVGGRCLLAAPNPERRGEVAIARAALAALGIEARPLAGRIEFGDVLVAGPDLVVAGLGPRTDRAGVAALREAVGSTHRLLVVDFRALAGDVRLAHLDLGFNLVGAGAALIHEPLRGAPAVIDGPVGDSRGAFADLLEAVGIHPLAVPAAAQERGGTNVLSLGPGRAVAYAEALDAGLGEVLGRAGVEAVPVPGAHLIQSGGGPRCLSLPLVRA
jgi:arginine deiminase